MLETKRRITLTTDPLRWVNDALRLPGFSLIPLSPEIAVTSSRLPGDFHGDPADRIIVASALVEKAMLITNDHKILDYGRKGFIETAAAFTT